MLQVINFYKISLIDHNCLELLRRSRVILLVIGSKILGQILLNFNYSQMRSNCMEIETQKVIKNSNFWAEVVALWYFYVRKMVSILLLSNFQSIRKHLPMVKFKLINWLVKMKIYVNLLMLLKIRMTFGLYLRILKMQNQYLLHYQICKEISLMVIGSMKLFRMVRQRK